MSFNLPPGCAVTDIDRAAGPDLEACRRCGEPLIPASELEAGICKECFDFLCAYCGEKFDEEWVKGIDPVCPVCREKGKTP